MTSYFSNIVRDTVASHIPLLADFGSSESKEKKDKQKAKRTTPVAPLAKIEPELKKELRHLRIPNLTKELWKRQYGKEHLDLSKPLCLGREKDLQQLSIRLTTSHTPCNVIVTGPTGVGKSLLIEELARQILVDEFHPLKNCHVLLMPDWAANLSVVQKIADSLGRNALLVFDECHDTFNAVHFDFKLAHLRHLTSFKFKTFVQALKPLLAKRQVRIVGMTDRLGKLLVSDSALARRFRELPLVELDIDSTIAIITSSGLAEELSADYKRAVSFSEEALRTAIYFSMAYYKKETLPAKAFQILEPAARWWLSLPQENVLVTPAPALVTPEVIKDYLVVIENKKREEVNHDLEEMVIFCTSPIPAHEPLAKFTKNLSALARRGLLPPAWGRDELLDSLATIFSSLESNNVLLTGPPGCGKSRIAEGLALAIHEGIFPELEGKEVLLLNWESARGKISELIASSAKYEGRFILVVDEIHRLGVKGGLDPSSMLSSVSSFLPSLPMNLPAIGGGSLEDFKEVLARGKLPMLALTTESEAYSIRKDEALKRRFIGKSVPVFTFEETLFVLKKEVPAFEKKYTRGHLIPKIEEEGLEAIFFLSMIYNKNEYQPAASLKYLHLICSYAMRRVRREEGEGKEDNECVVINQDLVINAISRHEHKRPIDVFTALEHERSEPPSSRLISPGEPLRVFSDDWTKEARLHKFPPMQGQEDLLADVMDVLCKPTCNNVILIGKAGVGKTTLIKRLANQMAEGNVPPFLRDKPLLAVHLGDLLKNPAAFREFVQSSKKYEEKYVLFVDEVHLLFPAPLSPLLPSGISLPVSNELEQLKPLLADGKLTLIGASTPEQFPSSLKEEAAERRFKCFEMLPPTHEEAFSMLQAARPNLEKALSERLKAEVTISDEALMQAIRVANPRRALPASAIAVLELGAVRKYRIEGFEGESFRLEAEDLVAEAPSYFEKHPFNNTITIPPLIGSLLGLQRPKVEPVRGFWSGFFHTLSRAISWPFRWLLRSIMLSGG